MEIFSIVCLVVILFGIQHLLSWFWRKNYKKDYLLVFGFMLTCVSLAVIIVIIKHIILWGKNLV